MVRSKRLLIPVSFACIIGVFLIALLYFIAHRKAEGRSDTSAFYEVSYQPADVSLDPFAAIDEEYRVSQDFISNLPIFVFTLAGEKENGLENGMLSVYNWRGEMNGLLVSPTQAMQIKLKIESTGEKNKPNLDLTVVDENGNPKKAGIMGFPEDTTFHLNSLRNDLSMVRTYTAYRTASQFMKFVPHVDFCEVLIERDGVLSYQGVYELCENLGVAPEQTMMVGNSFRSDIAPALEAGAWTVHIPYHVVWELEKSEEFPHERLQKISHFSELLDILG